MIKYYCDKCKCEVKDRFYSLPIYVHIMNDNHLDGYVNIIDNEFHPISGKTKDIQMCIKCYNEVMFPLWDTIKDDIKDKECKCESFTHHKEYDVFPYGDNIEYDKCSDCGSQFNYNVLK